MRSTDLIAAIIEIDSLYAHASAGIQDTVEYTSIVESGRQTH
jgi:hypothetical protein